MNSFRVGDFQFQVNDSPQTRTRKLEALRLSAASTAVIAGNGDWNYVLSDRLQGVWRLTPESLPLLSVGRTVSADIKDSVFEFDAPLTLGTRSWIAVADGASFRAAYRVRLASGSGWTPAVGFLLYTAEGAYLGEYGLTPAPGPISLNDGWVLLEAWATPDDLLGAYPGVAYVRSYLDSGEQTQKVQIASARMEDTLDTTGIEEAVAAAEAAAEEAIDAALAADGSASTAAGWASVASAKADEATGQASAAQASAVAAQSSANSSDISAQASAAQASSASTSATAAGSSAAAAEISRIAAQAANASATTQAGIATTKATEANSSAANALTSQNLSATYAGNAASSASAASGSAASASGSAASAQNWANISASFGGGGNLLLQSRFAVDTAGWLPYSANDPWYEWERDKAGDDWRPTNEHNLGIRQINGNSGTTASWYVDYISIKANVWYEFSALVAAHRCPVFVGIEWFAASGNWIANVNSSGFFPGSGGRNINNWSPAWIKAQAPSNAARCRCVFWKQATNAGQADSYAWMARPQLCETTQAASSPVPYSPAPDTATVAVQASAIANAQGQLSATWGVRLNAGKVTGVKAVASGTESSWIFDADYFGIDSAGQRPFEVISGTVYIKNAQIQSAAIDTGKIANNAVTSMATATNPSQISVTSDNGIDGVSIYYSCSGGKIRIDVNFDSYRYANGTGTSGLYCRILRSINGGGWSQLDSRNGNITNMMPPCSFFIVDDPGAGVITYKLVFDVQSTGALPSYYVSKQGLSVSEFKK